ncbi:DNA-binding response regulator, OmpR family, contains REC and winged-helix (wHTH) domain [Oceanospirillum multiglobuliferum]|uniref:Response regulatory domain-containing protein n=1 Tax=Oceanospirillum multiglobuliferum TaxID=64969 RepID=A0A1T4SB20_9GAMM|nr:response regulator transcription factor [Oceanospirillum multiglobuliferum]OPX55027.1 hypothetical protein BTE48_11050 [Oceanospirillum multiglobuliferum]SKA25510.1 DNA-binding response regulator, OmpR family, contains REC and winged-helix (wHTH) domain [Oceanospirillum multiglobuliferum]
MPARSELKLLLVEDHFALREMLVEYLVSLDYQVAAYESAEDALASADTDSSIALLDVNLPGEDGMFLAQQLRQKTPNIGIILMTVRNQLNDKLEGYNVGADFYLPKPVAPQELDAAIQALCRRLPNQQSADLVLNHVSQLLTASNNQQVVLSAEECRLLTVLAQAPKNQLEYWQLADYLALDLDSDTLKTTLEKRVSRLRRKLTQLDLPPTAVKALRGFGYQLTCSVQIH